MSEERERLKYKLYYAACTGMSISLYTMLSELDNNEANQLLNEVTARFTYPPDIVPLF